MAAKSRKIVMDAEHGDEMSLINCWIIWTALPSLYFLIFRLKLTNTKSEANPNKNNSLLSHVVNHIAQGRRKERLIDAKSSSTMLKQGAELSFVKSDPLFFSVNLPAKYSSTPGRTLRYVLLFVSHYKVVNILY